MSKDKAAQLRRQKKRLWGEQGGKCFWCHEEIILVEHPKDNPGRQHWNEATLDHLDSRLSSFRGKAKHGELRHVVACFRCNTTRGKQELYLKTTGEFVAS